MEGINVEFEKEIIKREDIGADLCGAGLYYRDLELALETGRDIDDADIPNNTPEERERKL